MQFLIDVRAAGDGWEVRILDPATSAPLADPHTHAPILDEPRALRRMGQGAEVFPLPPQKDVDALPANAPYRDLCAAADEKIVGDAYTNVLNQQGGVEHFGRYLLATLLGVEAWKKIDAAAGAEPVELALSFPDDDRALSRLPWEAMHFGGEAAQGLWQGFLAAEPQVAITRRVAGATYAVKEIVSPPRVLFVVGASLSDDVIRPGAEYLGLLRGLNHEGLYLKTHLLLQASTVKLEEVIKWFQPTVVHFICHGVVSPEGRGCLYMRPDNPQVKTPVAVNADALKQALQTSQNLPLPQIVVLNACSTAAAEELTAGRPLAAELVRLGVPIVAGMSGRVADQACRLFTTGFYKALLKGGEIAQAAAEGRRAAIRHGGYDPARNVDWALPTLFLSAGVAEARLTVTPQADEVERQRLAQDYAPPPYPPFCNRLEIFQTYNLLLADDTIQKSAAGREMQVMAVSVKQPDSDDPLAPAPRFGRTWLLKELAAQAILDGHVPCLVTKDLVGSGDWPKTLKDLLQPVMMRAANITAQRLSATAQHAGLDWAWNYLPQILNLPVGDLLPAGLPAAIRQNYYPADPTDAIAVAFRLDLLDLLKAVRAQRPEAERSRIRLLLLIDDAHQMGEVAGKLLNALLGTFGLRAAVKDARVVFTYSEVPATGQGPAVKAITDWVRSPWVELVTLGEFHRKDEKEYTAYKQFLLRWKDQGQDRPLALARTERDLFVQNFLNQLATSVEGIPSNLEPKGSPVIRTFFGFTADPNLPPEYKVLRMADDEDALKAVEQLKRG